MATHFEHYKSGQAFGIRYRFDAHGDGIPTHSHNAELAHNLIVMRGSVLLVTEKESRTCRPGIHDFDWAGPHRIVALEDSSETLHLFLNGQPKGYNTLPASELQGTLG